jgi:Rab-like protein 5
VGYAVRSYEACWPAVGKDADGVILVFNPDIEGQEQELVGWFERFVLSHNLTKQQCIIFANQSSHMKGRPQEPEIRKFSTLHLAGIRCSPFIIGA